MSQHREVQLLLNVRRNERWQEYSVSVPEEGYLLDALESAGRQDPTLLFRHACHHASCGSCGLQVNGRERLACITPVIELSRSGKPVRLEPLRNFPLIADLVVDLASLLDAFERVGLPPIRQAEPIYTKVVDEDDNSGFTRFEDCIECGLCVSSCPIVTTDSQYEGPATLAAAWRLICEPRGHPAGIAASEANDEQGLWRCHSAFECSEVCPSNVDPAGAIMRLRRWVLAGMFGRTASKKGGL